MSKKGNPVIYVEYMEQMNIGCKSTTINNNTTSINEREKKQQIQPTEVMTFECISALRNVAKSVGYLHGRIKSGTCWRVGEDKIITAYHVVRDNILTSAQQILHEHLLKDICIDFEYIGEQSGESEKWKVEENLLFYDENLDVAVLKLKRNENQTLPPPLNVFKRLNPAIHVDEKIYLISHNKGRQKELNYGIGLFEPTKSQMEKLEKFCDEYGEENGYVGLDSEERLVIQCKFEGGASGSPGIVLYNNIPHVVLMYLRGYPTFYYKQQFHEDSKRNFPQEKILQQGVNICSLYDTMGANPLHLNLMNEIFRREPEPQLKVNPQKNVHAMTGDGRDGANINLQTAVSVPPIEHDNIGNQQVQSQVVNQEDYAPQYERQLSQCLPSGKRQEFQMPGGHPKKKASPVLPIDSVSGPTEGNSGILQNTSAPVFDSDCAELPYLDKHIQLNKISSSSKVLPNVTLEEWIGQDPEVLPGIELEDGDLMFVSQAINSQAWNGVGLEFHLRQPDLDKIEAGSQNDKPYNMLYKWKNKNGKNATLRKCVEHLFDAWLKDNKKVYIDKLKDAIQRILKK